MGMMTERSRLVTVNQEGQRRIVVELETGTGDPPIPGPKKLDEGETEFFTEDGFDVTKNDDGTLTVVQTDEILTPLEDGDC